MLTQDLTDHTDPDHAEGGQCVDCAEVDVRLPGVVPGCTYLLREIHLGWDRGDGYGSAMTWLFAIATVLDLHGKQIPEEWGYSAGAAGPGIDDDDVAAGVINDNYGDGEDAAWNTADLLHAGGILDRLIDLYFASGQDY